MHRRKPFYVPPGARGIGWVPTALRAVLKIRYLLLGGALGGGASLAKVRKILAKLSSKTSWNLVLCHSMKLHKKHKDQNGTWLRAKEIFSYFYTLCQCMQSGD